MVNASKAMVPYLRTFTDEEKGLLAAMVAQVAPKATNDEKRLFLYVAQKKGLDPFDKQIYLVPRYTSEGLKHSVQVSIDGLRLMAQRSHEYEGQTSYQWCDKSGQWVDVWLDDDTMPVAARAGVYRKNFREPLISVARFNDYKQTKKDGSLNHFWKQFGPHMLAKCAEALSIRRAFPEETSGFYIAEEMGNAELVYSVEEVAQDTSAPIVGELVDDKGATEATNDSATVPATKGTKKAAHTKETVETGNVKNSDLADIPNAATLMATSETLGLSWSETLNKACKKAIDAGRVKLSDLLSAGTELPPGYCKAIAKWLDEYAAEPVGLLAS